MPIFTKNNNIWAPWNFLKMKTLTRMRRRVPKFWIWTWLLDLFCPIKKKSTLHPTVPGIGTV